MNTARLLLIPLFALIFASGCMLGPEPAETTITLRNDTDEVVYHQNYGWTEIDIDHPGAVVSYTCGRRCGENVETCAGAPFIEAIALQPGESVEFTWDGYYFVEKDDCYKETTRKRAFSYTTCWGPDQSQIEDTEMSVVEDEFCTSGEFERGEAIELLASDAQ